MVISLIGRHIAPQVGVKQGDENAPLKQAMAAGRALGYWCRVRPSRSVAMIAGLLAFAGPSLDCTVGGRHFFGAMGASGTNSP
jgi:hypothetical protein